MPFLLTFTCWEIVTPTELSFFNALSDIRANQCVTDIACKSALGIEKVTACALDSAVVWA